MKIKFKGIELEEGTFTKKDYECFFDLYDNKRHLIYWENSDGYWAKLEYDENGNKIYYDNSDGYWTKYGYDENGNLAYLENSSGYWEKQRYDKDGNQTYYENSNGKIWHINVINRGKVVK